MLLATSDPGLEPSSKQKLAIRIVAFALSCEHLELLTGLLLGGRMTFNFPHDLWTLAVQDYLDGKPLMEMQTAQSFVDILDLLPGRQSILLIDKQGKQLTDRAVTSLRFEKGKGVQLPVDLYIVHEAAPQRNLPNVIRIDCTGLGGPCTILPLIAPLAGMHSLHNSYLRLPFLMQTRGGRLRWTCLRKATLPLLQTAAPSLMDYMH